MSSTFDMFEEASKVVEAVLKNRGEANILLAGKTGVGKSTLLNSILDGNFVETGQGRPVTKTTRKISKEGVPVSIYDTRGLEVKDYKETLDELIALVDECKLSTNPHEHIHACWLCISEGSRRIEDAEIELAKAMSKKMPVIVVITKAQSDQGFRNKAIELIPEARNHIRVNSIPTVFDNGLSLPKMGLDHLVILTMEVIPEGQQQAFAAAQTVLLEMKVSKSHKIVATAAASAAGAAAVPVPFSEFVAIIPIQMSMLAGISASFGLKLDKAFLGTLVSGSLSTVSSSVGGRALVGSLLKLFPGVGSVGGVAISSAVSAAITTAFGEAYIATLNMLLKENPNKELTVEEVTKGFKEKLKNISLLHKITKY